MELAEFEINANSPEDFRNEAFEIVSLLRPEWGSKLNFLCKQFTDGLTNKLIGVYVKDLPKNMMLIRVYGLNSDLMIDRQKEIRNMKILHKNGCGAQLYAIFKNGIAYEYQSGSTLTVQSICDPEVFPALAKAIAKMHSVKEDLDKNSSASIEKKPCLWDLLRKFQILVPDGFPNDPEKNSYYKKAIPFTKIELAHEIDRMEELFLQMGIVERSKIVFSHNDLMPNNILIDFVENLHEDDRRDEDGKERKINVSIIDYEYGDWNYREFDIANHFNEFVGLPHEQTGILDYDRYYPSQEFQTEWLQIYLMNLEIDSESKQDLKGLELQSKVEELRDLVEKFSPLSNLLWGIWSLIQAKHSDIDFDYINYAMQRLTQYKKCSIKS